MALLKTRYKVPIEGETIWVEESSLATYPGMLSTQFINHAARHACIGPITLTKQPPMELSNILI